MRKSIKPDDKILVAGAQGMVGSSIVRKLIEKGFGDKKNGGSLLTPTKNELDLISLNPISDILLFISSCI